MGIPANLAIIGRRPIRAIVGSVDSPATTGPGILEGAFMRFAFVLSIFVTGVAAVPAMAADGTPTFTKDVAPIFY